mgnify:CR=1 FL=1
MSEVYEKLLKCCKSVREKTDFVPEAALILGSGLGDYADDLKIEASVNYADIEGFPVSTVKGHKGRFVFAHVEGVPVVIMQGRVHYYEGYPMSDVVLPTRLMGLLGAKKIILTNAAGGVNYNFKPGDFMLITDHITTAVPNPLIGENIDELGTRFPDMSEVYAPELQEKVRKAAEKLQVPLQEGVYMQFTGPSYETPAEIRMCRTWGGDAAGMSTACEAVAYGNESLWYFLYYQPCRRHVKTKAGSQRSAGDSRPSIQTIQTTGHRSDKNNLNHYSRTISRVYSFRGIVLFFCASTCS